MNIIPTGKNLAGTRNSIRSGIGIGKNWVEKGSGIGKSPEFSGISFGNPNQGGDVGGRYVIGH